jgi:hypothetical protein
LNTNGGILSQNKVWLLFLRCPHRHTNWWLIKTWKPGKVFQIVNRHLSTLAMERHLLYRESEIWSRDSKTRIARGRNGEQKTKNEFEHACMDARATCHYCPERVPQKLDRKMFLELTEFTKICTRQYT